MKKTISLLVLIDIIGKISYKFPLLLVVMVMIFLYRPIMKYLSKVSTWMFGKLKEGNKFVYYWIKTGGILLIILIMLLVAYSFLMSMRGIFDEEILGFLSVVLLFSAYLSLSLVIFNMFFRANNIISQINRPMVILIFAVIVMIMVEAISALLFYKDGYYQYKDKLINFNISQINQKSNQDDIIKLFNDLISSDINREATHDSLVENFSSLKRLVDEHNILIDSNFAKEIREYSLKSNVKDGEFPSLNLFMKLYKFSFYQHYMLGLDDELLNYQKFIASNIYLSIIQMVHILFTKLIDLIIIGKIISILTKDMNQEES
ncbi:hypothetical protein M3661_29210 [Paenibacillus sp. MER 180]|uniref:hypothetical protein n=1 Tax=Paenibacillus sp. MER 180 TaxID=2939570 RepID=UPI00203BD68F|nr:hypothetical protein [Paenibacillus sp. MER 180]MCM3294179.1 hypothetical protein [Paenibacillus sp. MER 180]